MYLNDALDVARPRKIEPPRKIDPRLLEFADEAQGSGRGHTVGKPQKGLMQTGICRYQNGRHACYDYSDYCPARTPRVYVQEREQDIIFRPMRVPPNGR